MTFQMILGLMTGVCVVYLSYFMGVTNEKKRRIKELNDFTNELKASNERYSQNKPGKWYEHKDVK